MAGDRLLKVENSKMGSWMISWRAFDGKQFKIHWQMDSVGEQIFIFLPSEVVILDPIVKRRQSSFLY